MDLSERERIETSDELTKVFQDGSIFGATDNDLRRYLKYLCSGHIPNEMVRHREMNRCLVISTLQTRRFIEKVDGRNRLYTIVNLVLAAAAVSLAVISIVKSNSSTEQVDRLISAQDQRGSETQRILEAHLTEQRQALENILKQQTAAFERLKQSAPNGVEPKPRSH
jgi:hypothetical protein